MRNLMRNHGRILLIGLLSIAVVVSCTLTYLHSPAPAAVPILGARTALAGSGGVTAGRFVKLSAAGVIVTATASTDAVVGIAERTAAANAMTSYAPMGTQAVVLSGEAIAVGDLVTAGTGGAAFVADSNDTLTQRTGGIALTAASGAAQNVTIILSPGLIEAVPKVMAGDANAVMGIPFIVEFPADANGNYDYVVPTGRKLRVVSAVGSKTAGNGAHADDEVTVANGSSEAIFTKKELNGVNDGVTWLFTGLDDSKRDIAAAGKLRVVALENGANGCNCIVAVTCCWITP